MQHSPRATVIWQVSFHMRVGQELEWSSKRKQNQPASLNQINPEMLKKGCALLRHPLLRQKWLKPWWESTLAECGALQALLQPFESGLECKSASRVCQVSAATFERLMIYDVNYMDCNQLATSYIPIFTTPQKKFNHGGCTYTGNLPVSLHSALYLRNYTASNLGELFLYKKNSERYVIDTTAAHTPQAVN